MTEFITGLIIIGTIFYGAFLLCTRAGRLECDQWGGSYNWASGCLVNIEGQQMTLSDYREIVKVNYTKPVPTNANINLGLK